MQQSSDQYGSVILAILSMATLSGIALLMIMFSLKSLNKNLTLTDLQSRAQQVLNHEHLKSISNYLAHPNQGEATGSSTILADGVEYTYIQYPHTIRLLNWPLPGFSLQSNYASTYAGFKSQITMDIIQTPILSTGISCINLKSDRLNRNPQRHYALSFNHQLIDTIYYDFNSDIGEIRKSTATNSVLLMDLDFESQQSFSRVDFAEIRVSDTTRLAVIFAVTNSRNTTPSPQNKLYVLFDDLLTGQQFTAPLMSNELITITEDYLPTGHEKGFILPLNPGKLDLSAITTVNHQIVFITQWPQIIGQTLDQTYKNEYYQINMAPAQSQTIQTRTLPDSNQLLQLTTHLVNQSGIVIGSQITPFLAGFAVNCRQVLEHEE